MLNFTENINFIRECHLFFFSWYGLLLNHFSYKIKLKTMQNQISKNKFSLILLVVLGISTLLTNSCSSGGDDPTPTPTPTGSDEMYIIFKGQKVICRVPADTYRTSNNPNDTTLTWSGNIPLGVGGDTLLTIIHPGPRLQGVKYKTMDYGIEDDEVMIRLRWSIIAGQPNILFDGGDYKLEKLKGKWVSTMKNGTGYDVKDGTKKYSNIEFRIIWP